MMKRTFSAVIIVLALVCSLIPQSALAIETPDSYTPYELKAEQMDIDGTHPYGSALLTFKINDLPSETGDPELTWFVGVEKKIGNGEWIEVELVPSVTLIQNNMTSQNEYRFEQIWIEDYEWDGSAKINYRVYVILDDLVSNRGGKSGYSNVAAIGLQSSAWAVSELKKAEELGLMPDRLVGADLTRPITREEFAELAVLLYEKSTQTTASASAANPFTDTQNAEILKAYQLGITSGTSATTFSPNVLINREQCAAMLFRAIKAIAPAADYSIAGVQDFPDQKYIAGYAVEATKYMSKIGIITGDSQGKFMPKATTTADEAAGYGMATREQAIAMTVRTYDKVQ